MSAPVFVGDWEAGSPEWLAARQQGIGGSEIAAVLGLSPWESRFSLWHRKKGMLAPVVETDAMYWGKIHEPSILAEWNKRRITLALPRQQHATPVGTFCHPDRPWQIANPDGLVVANYEYDSLLEIKTARDGDGWGEPGTDEIPVYYRTQVLWYLDVFGLQTCHVAVLIAGSDYREYRVEYDADEAEFMRNAARDFLDELDTGQRPDIDSHSATYDVVRELHPEIEPEKVDLPVDIAVPFLCANAAVKAAEAEQARAKSVLADHMGSARYAYHDGQKIAIRTSRNGGIPYVQATPAKKTTGQKVVAA